MAGDFIGDVNPISVGDTGDADIMELKTVKHQTIQRMFPIEFGAAETGFGGVVAKYCPDGSTDDQRPAMCETYNKAWNDVVDRCGRDFPPRAAGLALSLIPDAHSPRRFEKKWFPAFQKCGDSGVDTVQVKTLFDNELAAVKEADSSKNYDGIDAISSFQQVQPDEMADYLDQYNEVVDATDNAAEGFAKLWSKFLIKTIGSKKGKINYGINLEHHAGKLLKVNFDHFSREGHAAYVAGHYLAMKKANEAHVEYMKSREAAGEKKTLKFEVTADFSNSAAVGSDAAKVVAAVVKAAKVAEDRVVASVTEGTSAKMSVSITFDEGEQEEIKNRLIDAHDIETQDTDSTTTWTIATNTFEDVGPTTTHQMTPAQADAVKALIRDALIFNGMADHFLTDMFAAGHARTPRFELFAQCGMTSGGFYSNAQHDEENQRGVIMKNKKDEMWLALGDSMLWNYGNRDNRKKAHQAAKASLREVALCFQKGCPDDVLATKLPLGALEIAPDLEHMLSKVAVGEPAPMFLLDDRCPASGRAPTTGLLGAMEGCNCLLADKSSFADESVPTKTGGATVHDLNCIWMPKIWRRSKECTMKDTFSTNTFWTHSFAKKATTGVDGCG